MNVANAISTAKFYAGQVGAAMSGGATVLRDETTTTAGGNTTALGGATSGMNNVLNIICDIMRYAGVAMLIYGVYEIIMSVQNNQPEAKTKGVIMALSGVVMVSIKTVITAFNVGVSF